MKRFTMPSLLRTLFSERFFSPTPLEESIDAARLAESLLPVSQLYGFEMSYIRSREVYEK